MKQLIMDVLEDMSSSQHGQVNLASNTARETIANLIVATIRSKDKGWYLNCNHTKEQEEEDKKLLESYKTEEQKAREAWVCYYCGKNTYDVDYEYIGSCTNHLGCELEADKREKNWLQKNDDDLIIGIANEEKVFNQEKRVKKKFYEDMGDGHMIAVGKLSEEIVDSKEGEWIYESPDSGKTVFRRPFSDYNPKNKEEIDFKTKEPTGRIFTDYPFKDEVGVK
jgi:hypothetical protein